MLITGFSHIFVTSRSSRILSRRSFKSALQISLILPSAVAAEVLIIQNSCLTEFEFSYQFLTAENVTRDSFNGVITPLSL